MKVSKKTRNILIGIVAIFVIGKIGGIFIKDDNEIVTKEPKKNIEVNSNKEVMSNDTFEKEVNVIEPNLDPLENNKYADIDTIDDMIKKSEASSSYIIGLKSKYDLNEEQEDKLNDLNDKFNAYTVHYYSQKNELEKGNK